MRIQKHDGTAWREGYRLAWKPEHTSWKHYAAAILAAAILSLYVYMMIGMVSVIESERQQRASTEAQR